jgi:hypothetical protein
MRYLNFKLPTESNSHIHYTWLLAFKQQCFVVTVTFEDKRKENFEKGQAELERRRKALLEIQRKEQEERERKEKEEQEKRERIR